MLIAEDGTRSESYDNLLSKAKGLDFSDMDGENKAFAAMAAVLLPTVVKGYKAAQHQIRDLKALNSEYRGSRPSPTAGGAAPPAQGGGEVTPESMIAAFINS